MKKLIIGLSLATSISTSAHEREILRTLDNLERVSSRVSNTFTEKIKAPTYIAMIKRGIESIARGENSEDTLMKVCSSRGTGNIGYNNGASVIARCLRIYSELNNDSRFEDAKAICPEERHYKLTEFAKCMIQKY